MDKAFEPSIINDPQGDLITVMREELGQAIKRATDSIEAHDGSRTAFVRDSSNIPRLKERNGSRHRIRRPARSENSARPCCHISSVSLRWWKKHSLSMPKRFSMNRKMRSSPLRYRKRRYSSMKSLKEPRKKRPPEATIATILKYRGDFSFPKSSRETC